MEFTSMKTLTVAAMIVAGTVGAASAATIQDGVGNGGNPCPSGPLRDCSLQIGDTSTPAIAKFNRLDSGSYSFDGANTTAFPSLSSDGSEFTLTQIDSKTASFSYMLGIDDPFLTGVAVKGGAEGFKLFTFAEGDFAYDSASMTFSGQIDTVGLLNNGQQQPAISNVTFFDTMTPPAPVPFRPLRSC